MTLLVSRTSTLDDREMKDDVWELLLLLLHRSEMTCERCYPAFGFCTLSHNVAYQLDALLLNSENHLFALALARHSTLLAMFPNILLSPLDGRQLLPFDLSCFLHSLW